MQHESYTRPASSLEPHAVQFEFTVAAPNIDAVCEMFDRVVDFAEGIGFLFEGGGSQEMALESVIADSPLDRHLKGTCAVCDPLPSKKRAPNGGTGGGK